MRRRYKRFRGRLIKTFRLRNQRDTEPEAFLAIRMEAYAGRHRRILNWQFLLAGDEAHGARSSGIAGGEELLGWRRRPCRQVPWQGKIDAEQAVAGLHMAGAAADGAGFGGIECGISGLQLSGATIDQSWVFCQPAFGHHKSRNGRMRPGTTSELRRQQTPSPRQTDTHQIRPAFPDSFGHDR